MQNLIVDLIRALRPRHWIKNILVLVAPLGAGALTWETVPLLFLSFLSLSAAASATYLLNDVKDREYDSVHPTKRFRAIASGRLKPGWAAGIAVALVAIATLLMVPANFLAFVAVVSYFALATLYSLWLKRVPALDIVVLAGLFVMRILVGAFTVGVEVSNWLLATSFFVFLSLAAAKRFIELNLPHLGTENELVHGRGYVPSDGVIVQIGGFSSGLISALLLGQYVETSHTVGGNLLTNLVWFAVPLWVYWITRLWILVSRGRVADDPVEFVVRDIVSYVVAAMILGFYLLSRSAL